MRVAIIGAGNVGGTLGTARAQKAGHEIFFGVRNPTSDQTQAVVRRLDGRGRRRHGGTGGGIRPIHRADDAMECSRSGNPLDGRFERKDYPRCVQITVRWGGGNEAEIRKYADELIALTPDVILANARRGA